MRLTSLFVALTVLGPSATAQIGSRCPLLFVDGVVQNLRSGPGAAFGVTSYQCASCGIKQEKDAPAEYTFHAEPVVLQVDSWSALRAGDVIEAVNGHPITTRAGVDQFTHPPLTESVLLIRRGGSRTEVKMVARERCEEIARLDVSTIARVEVVKGQTALLRYGLDAMQGAVVVTTRKDSLPATRDQRPNYRIVRPEPTSASSELPGHGRYGFAISCVPSCTRARAADGTEYWKFDATPPIAGIMPGSPAGMSGLRVGDIVTEIDGISILTEEGALRFQRSERKESIHVTVLRDGRKVGYLLQPR